MSRPHLWPWVRPFVVLTLVLSIPPIVYWFGYVQNSVQATKRQAHATLSAVTAELRGRLAAHDQIAGNAARYSGNEAKLRNYLTSVVRPRSIAPTTAGEQRLQVDADRGGLNLHVGRNGTVLRASIPLENLVPWNVVETEFDGLLVLSDNGRLVAQDRRLPGQPLGLPVAVERGGKAIEFGRLLGASDTVVPEQDAAAPAPTPRFRSPFDFSDEPVVRVAGVEYLALLQPVSVAVNSIETGPAGASGRVQLLVCGLIQK